MLSEINQPSDIRSLLQKFGIIIYTGDREADHDLMLDELTELYQYGLIEKEIYLQARKVLRIDKPQ